MKVKKMIMTMKTMIMKTVTMKTVMNRIQVDMMLIEKSDNKNILNFYEKSHSYRKKLKYF